MNPDNLLRFLDAGIIYPLCYEENSNYLENRQKDYFDMVPQYIPVFDSIRGEKDECVVEIILDNESADLTEPANERCLYISKPLPVSRIRALHFSGAPARKKFSGMIAGTSSIIPTTWCKASGRNWGAPEEISKKRSEENLSDIKIKLKEFDQILGMLAYVRHGRLLHYLTADVKNHDNTNIPFISPEAFAFIAFLTGNDYYMNRSMDEFLKIRSAITDRTFRVLAGTMDSGTETGNPNKTVLYNNLLSLLNELVESGHDRWNAETVLRDWYNRLSSESEVSGMEASEIKHLLELADKAGEVAMGLLSMDEILTHPVLRNNSNLAPVRLMFLLSGFKQRSSSYTAKEAFRNALFRSDTNLFNVNEKQLALLIAGKYYGYRVLPLLEPVRPKFLQEFFPQLNLKLSYADPVEMHLIDQVYSSVFVPGQQSRMIEDNARVENVQIEKEIFYNSRKLMLQYLPTSIGNLFRLVHQEESKGAKPSENDTLEGYPSDISETLLWFYIKVHLPQVASSGPKEVRMMFNSVIRRIRPQLSYGQEMLLKRLIDFEKKIF